MTPEEKEALKEHPSWFRPIAWLRPLWITEQREK